MSVIKLRNLIRLYSKEYKAATEQAQAWGVGGDSSRALNAVTIAITAALGGQTDLQVATNALAPYAAQLISHAILGATLAYINGGDPTAGGSAAVASEAAANYLTNQYKDDPRYKDKNGEFQANLLPEDVKAQIRDLTAGIGAVIGGAVGDSSYNAQLAGVIGQNAVENNNIQDNALAKVEGKTLAQKAEELVKEQDANYRKNNCAGLSASACTNQMYKERQEFLKDVADYVPVISTIKGYSEAETLGDYLIASLDLIGPAGKIVSKSANAYMAAKAAKDTAKMKAAMKAMVQENIAASKASREFSNYLPASKTIETKYFENISNKNFFENVKYTEKVKKQISADNYHGFPKAIDDMAAKYGKTTVYTGSKDGVPRLKLEIKGSYNGKNGTFEYIRNPNGTINHRLFVPNKD